MELDDDFDRGLLVQIRYELENLDRKLFSDSCPEELIHYTSPEGFKGILSTHELWATDIRHVTDKCECNYGMNVIREVITTNQLVPKMMRSAIQNEPSLFGTKKIVTSFIACFCSSKKESSYMWENYAADGTGYALVFDRKNLSEGPHGSGKYSFFPLIYDESVQIEKTTQIIEGALQLQHSLKICEKSLDRFWLDEVAFCLMVCGLRFKKPCFRDEQEIRFFAWDPGDLKKVTVNGKTHIAIPFENSAILRHIQGPNAT